MQARVLALFVAASFAHGAEGIRAPDRLRCEYLANPPVVDVPNPRFSWRDTLTLRFRFATNCRQVEVQMRVDEKKYTLDFAAGELSDEIWSEAGAAKNVERVLGRES